MLKKPEKYEDLIEVINIIIQSKQSNLKSYPFFKKAFELCSIDEEKFYILEKAYTLSNKNILVNYQNSSKFHL